MSEIGEAYYAISICKRAPFETNDKEEAEVFAFQAFRTVQRDRINTNTQNQYSYTSGLEKVIKYLNVINKPIPKPSYFNSYEILE